ncbi:hypothetical protein [Sulfitobacter sp. S190]|uniref:hypothetical protein n=1 Tax=Sulfitobacter sp. S190 TaxID=2867022 RepID=UPI0021A3624E|nr:hypothetical protein [Sulfitobacter sp. S190]UWR21217.1 hypothetical protein K3756_10865 [Sulfitobacter sp. S190]
MIRSKYFIHPLGIKTKSKLDLALRLRAIINAPTQSSKPPDRILRDNRSDVALSDEVDDFSGAAFSRCFEALRRNHSAEWSIAIPGLDVAEGGGAYFSKLYLLNSGDLCVVTGLNGTFSDDEFAQGTDWYRKEILPDIKAFVTAVVQASAMTSDEKTSLDFNTPIHTVFGLGLPDVSGFAVVADQFRSEGLDATERCISQDSQDTWRLYGGWSYSAIQRTDYGEEFYFVSVMVRMQNEWFALRRWRRQVLIEGDSPMMAKNHRDLKQKHTAIHEMLYLLQRHQQEAFDFRANLKPWLQKACEGVSSFWDLPKDYEFINASTGGLRDLISFSIQERELAQSRVQSRVLYLIAGFDTLALSGFLLSVLSFQRSEQSTLPMIDGLLNDTFVAALLSLNVVFFFMVLVLAFVRAR